MTPTEEIVAQAVKQPDPPLGTSPSRQPRLPATVAQARSVQPWFEAELSEAAQAYREARGRLVAAREHLAYVKNLARGFGADETDPAYNPALDGAQFPFHSSDCQREHAVGSRGSWAL